MNTQEEKQPLQNTMSHAKGNVLCTAQELIDVFCEQKLAYAVYGNKEASWNCVSIDSRNVSAHTLFFGLAGDYTNGGTYIQEVMDSHASVAVIDLVAFRQFLYQHIQNNNTVSQEIVHYATEYDVHFENMSRNTVQDTAFQEFVQSLLSPNVTLIVVRDSTKALMLLTTDTINRQRDTVTVIAISGSMGKTTTKDMLVHILQHFHPTVYSLKNLNTVQGLAISVLNASWDNVRYAVLEYGISTTGEMDMLVDMITPDIAVLTNVGTAHLGGYASKQELQAEKLKIAKHRHKTKMLFLPEEDKQLQAMADTQGISYTLFGKKSMPAELHIKDMQLQGIDITCTTSDGEKQSADKNIHIVLDTFIGASNIANIYTSLQVAEYLGFSLSESIVSLKGVQHEKQRFEIRSKEPLIIDDSYNANYEAMQCTLQWFVSLSYTYTIAILGGMKELGTFSNDLHIQLVHFVQSLALTHVVWIGKEYQFSHMALEHCYSTVHEAKDFIRSIIQSLPKHQTAVILKGSNSYALHELIKNNVL